ncbi:MAG: permease prefix domain 1-containing protein [bacterium]|jgi:hypothetical protein
MMPSKEISVDIRIQKYIENLFAEIGASQQLFDLKEELTTNIKEKIADYQSHGMDNEQAFKEAIISMGDLSGLVDDMRKLGQDIASQSVYSSMSMRVSNAGIIVGVLLVLFGLFTSLMMYYMSEDATAVAGTGIFVVAGGILVTCSFLTRETARKYAMNKLRAALYALAVGLLLFSVFAAVTSRYATGEMFIAVASLMVFFLAGIGLLLFLVLTETDHRK